MTAGAAYDRVVLGICNHRHITESRMSDCEHGCKHYRCRDCQKEVLVHHIGYGCSEQTDWDDWR